jgi:hypothetical protein
MSAELPEGVVTLAQALEGALEEIEEAYVNNPENKEANA